jgi:glucose-6-phosphate 1-dehydrogenase
MGKCGMRPARHDASRLSVWTRTGPILDVMIAPMFEANEDNIAYPAPGSRTGAPPTHYIAPHVVVLFGATGDLARRKLLPGLARLSESALAPALQIVGTSLDDLDDASFRQFARSAIDEFGAKKLADDQVKNFTDKVRVRPSG